MQKIEKFSTNSYEISKLITCEELWWTLTSKEYDLFWPLDKLKDSDGIDIALALLGGWSSEGFTGTSTWPRGSGRTGQVKSLLFFGDDLRSTISTLTLSCVFSPIK